MIKVVIRKLDAEIENINNAVVNIHKIYKKYNLTGKDIKLNYNQDNKLIPEYNKIREVPKSFKSKGKKINFEIDINY